jgi:hypothetical protein
MYDIECWLRLIQELETVSGVVDVRRVALPAAPIRDTGVTTVSRSRDCGTSLRCAPLERVSLAKRV